MYLDFSVKVPEVKGKITTRRKKETSYVEYEYDRIYDPIRQFTLPKRVTIGKIIDTDTSMMLPNQNFLKYFPDAELPETKSRTSRSSCLRIGDYLVIRKIIEEYRLSEILGKYMNGKDLGLFLDLVAYSIVTESNAGQYYPNYAYNHPLFTENMRVCSDVKVSELLHSISEEQSVEFLNEWNTSRDHREKIYISYDSTNKNCQAGDLEIVEYGHPKTDVGLPIFNYAVAYDTNNSEPLFYEKYPGSITDVSQLEFMLDKAYGYGYRRIGFILDRGYFSRQNLEQIDKLGYSFVIMIKGMGNLVNHLVSEQMGTFEKKRSHCIEEYGVYGTTVKTKLYETDEEERYVHIYHSIQKESAERTQLESKIRKMKLFLDKHVNESRQFGPGFERYFILHYNEKTGKFQFAEERIAAIEEEIRLSGYFCLVTSDKMTAKTAINLYKNRDVSEKLFRGDKSYLGNKSLRIYSDDAAETKIFIEFVAMIIRNRIYNCLKEKMKTMESRPNYMTVPAALKELEKIEMVRMTDTVYRLDHAVTKTQKTILSAFGIDVPNVKYWAQKISKELAERGE